VIKKKRKEKKKKKFPERKRVEPLAWKSASTEGTTFRPLIIVFVSGELLVRILRYPIFFYHLIKQPVTQNTRNPTTEKTILKKLPRFSHTLRIIFVP